ncbi:MAG: protein translocase subunit SecD [Pseudomonadota bacterium]
MNRYPLWKYLLILAIVVPGFIYFLPNLYGEDPAIQVSATRTTKVDATTLVQVEQVLKHAGIDVAASQRDDKGIKVRFRDTDAQLKARDTVQRALGDNYTVALNLLPATPAWFGWINANPMYLGLDLRGGVHFLMQVDMVSALKKAEERYVDDLRSALREKKVRYLTVTRLESGGLEVRFRDVAERDKGREVVRRQLPELGLIDSQKDSEYFLLARLTEQSMTEKRKFALDQNIVALRNRVNELGVAEPVIQQQGIDRIVVQLPGVQDTAKAKEILGRTATLEIMLVDEEHDLTAALSGHVPAGSKLYKDRRGRPILLKKQVIYSGDNIVDAAAGFDSQAGGAVAHITLDARGAAINQRITGESVGKRMAVVYIEIKSETRLDAAGKPLLDAEGRQARSRVRVEEVITAPVIREQIGKRFQITGLDSIEEARDLALLLRAGALAAPIEIIEERTIGPSLGAENIQRGFHSTWIGFAAIAVFMIIYYLVFGVTAVLALGINVVLLVALLSLLQATLTLPGMAAIALTVGMAIDANVLINERIREELRNGNTPQASIHAGYERAFGTIFDSNITTLIAGVTLFMFGSGPVRGFAVVLCLGIITSMFSGVMVSRALVNLIYGGRRKLERLAIGNTQWK